MKMVQRNSYASLLEVLATDVVIFQDLLGLYAEVFKDEAQQMGEESQAVLLEFVGDLYVPAEKADIVRQNFSYLFGIWKKMRDVKSDNYKMQLHLGAVTLSTPRRTNTFLNCMNRKVVPRCKTVGDLLKRFSEPEFDLIPTCGKALRADFKAWLRANGLWFQKV